MHASRLAAHVICAWLCLTATAVTSGRHQLNDEHHAQLKHVHVRRHADHALIDHHQNFSFAASSCSLFSVVNGSLDSYRMYHCPTRNAYFFDTANPQHTPSFLVRVIGPHTLTTQLSHRRNDHTHAVAYATPHAGTYHAFIRVLMEDVQRDNPAGACMSTLPAVQHAFHVASSGGEKHQQLDDIGPGRVAGDVDEGNNDGDVDEGNNDGDVDEGNNDGDVDEGNKPVHTSLTDGSPTPVAPPPHYWQSTTSLADRWPHLRNVTSNQANVQHDYTDWHLHHPALLPIDTIARCMAPPTTICLYGDSQTRHLTDSMQSFAKAHGLSNVTLAYGVLRFPGNLTSALADTAGRTCTHSLFSFGHWPLSWVEFRPWTVTEWRRELDTFLKGVAGALASTAAATTTTHPSTLHWVSMPPFPTTHFRVTACPPVDWRLLPNIDAFNRVARQLVDAHHPHVHYINTYDAMLHMHDFTYDGSHYLEPVGPAVAGLVLSELCKARHV